VSVLVVGAGGIGAPVIRILRQAGVSDITVVDPDVVSLENLHRQILFADADLGRKKVEVIREKYDLDARAVRLDDETGPGLVRGRGCVIDGTDNFADKYRINDLCLAEGVPLVHAAAAQFRGQVLLVRRGGPCLRCVLPVPPAGETDECRTSGIFGPAAGLVAALAASEALRALAGEQGSPLLLADLARGRLRRTRLDPKGGCVCSRASAPILLR